MEDLLAAPIGAFLIFGLRVVDVSLGMVRMLFAVRGYRLQAASIGFVEILIWIIAIGAALQHLSSPFHVIGYAAGFAAGNYVGVWVEERFAMGTNVVRAVCQGGPDGDEGAGREAATALRDRGFAVTEVEGRGREHPVNILNVVARRKQVPEVIEVVERHDADAFVTVQDIRSFRGGYLRARPLRLPFRSRRGAALQFGSGTRCKRKRLNRLICAAARLSGLFAKCDFVLGIFTSSRCSASRRGNRSVRKERQSAFFLGVLSAVSVFSAVHDSPVSTG